MQPGVQCESWLLNGTRVSTGTYPYGEIFISEQSLGIYQVTSSLNGTDIACQVESELFHMYLIIVEGKILLY